MKASVKTALLMGVALIALSACSSGKGPGELGTKNDIVVRNHGEPRDTAPAGDFTSSVETAAAVPPAEVAQGEPVPAPVATGAEAQAVAAQSAPVGSTTVAPINDGTPSVATAPVQQNVAAETPVPVTPVTAQSPAPQAEVTNSPSSLPSEPYATPRASDPVASVSTTNTAVPAAAVAAPVAQQTYPASGAPVGEPIARPQDTVSPVVPVVPPAPAVPAQQVAAQTPPPVAVPKNPNASFYDYLEAGQTKQSSGIATSTATATTSGDVSKVKAVLAAKGLYAGSQNDAVDSEFLNALAKYQGENGLPMGGVNAETKQHLGIAQ